MPATIGAARASATALITAHGEGGLLREAIASARLAIARAGGIDCELLVVLDRATPDTRAAAEASVSEGPARLLSVDVGDAALARMAGVETARGRWIALLDGDDLWGPSWLARACETALAQPDERFVLHPAGSLLFGERAELWPHVSSNSTSFSEAAALGQNPWTALSFFPRALAREIPWRPARAAEGFGFEDWHWHCETLAAGVRHLAVEAAAHFVRVRPASRSAEHRGSAALLPPTSFASPERLRRLLASGRGGDGAKLVDQTLLTLETALRTQIESLRNPVARAALRALAGGLHRAQRTVNPVSSPVPLPAWVRAEREPLTGVAKALARPCVDAAPARNLNVVADAQAWRFFAQLCLGEFSEANGATIAIGLPGYLRTALAEGALAIQEPCSGALRRRAWATCDGVVLSDARLSWLTRAILQARPARLRLEPSAFARRLLRLHGRALKAAGLITESELEPSAAGTGAPQPKVQYRT